MRSVPCYTEAMEHVLLAPRFCLQPTAANRLGPRLLSGSVRVLVVRDGGIADGPRPGARLFDIHRALEPDGVCLWQCRRGELVALLNLARGYGFDAEPPALFWQDDGSDWVVALRRGPGRPPVNLPPVLRERDEGADVAWARALVLALGACGGEDGAAPVWVVEPDAPDTTLAEVALGLGQSWLGRLVAANDDGEACAWMRRLAGTGARSASAVPQMLGPDVVTAPAALADLFPEHAERSGASQRQRRAKPRPARLPELPMGER